jgi:hypothetical protein
LKETKKETNEGEPMKKVTAWGAALGLLGMSASAFAQFSSGNLVLSVIKSGSGSAPTNAANRRILREIRTDGTTTGTAPDVLVYGLASELTGNNRRLTNSGTATSEGFIDISKDGRYIVFAGYDAEIGTAGVVAANPTPAIARVVGRYEWKLAPSATTLDTSTFLTDAYLTNNIRSVTSLDGSGFWTAGTAAGTAGGVRYVPYSATPAGTSTLISAAPTNTRVVRIYNGQLYVTTASGTFVGVNAVGTGTPTASEQTTTLLPGFSGLVGSGANQNASPYDFVFDGTNTVYIADDFTSSTNPNADPGLQKWVNGDNGWTKVVTYPVFSAANPTAKVGLRGLTQQSSTVYYAITTDKRLVKLELTGNQPTDVTVTPLATAPTDEEWRDVKLLPTLGNTISGTISFQTGLENVPRNQELRVTLTPIAPSTGDPINLTVTPDANGNFTISAPAGNYRVRIKTAGTLSEAANINISNGNVTGASFTLRGGDINDDNAADITDLLALIGAYNTNTGGATDINGDGGTDITDLLILIGNYNQLGEV